jgi:quinol monooxygenase YgiN
MQGTYVIVFTVREGQRERFLTLLNGVLDAMRHESTFLSATLNDDPEDPNRFLLHEIWSDHQDVIDVQVGREYRQEWHAALDSLLEKPREISVWRPMRADNAKAE